MAQFINAAPRKNDLHKDLKTVCYEFQMLAATANRLSSDKFLNDTAMQNALIESFALHARALLHFFYWNAIRPPGTSKLFQSGKHRNDVVADDFFALIGATWSHKPKISATLIRAKDRADKQIAHITILRRTLNSKKARGKEWQFQRIVNHLSKVMNSFLDNAPNLNETVATRIRQSAAQAMATGDVPS
jgi:hypothetical protein